MDHGGDAFLGGVDGGEAFLGEDDGLDAVHLGGGTGEAAPLEVGLDVVEIPLFDEGAGLAHLRDALSGFLFLGLGVGEFLGDGGEDFAGGAGAFELHHAFGGGGAGLVGGIDDGDEDGQAGFEDFPAVADVAADADGFVGEVDEFFEVGDLGDVEFFGELGADLGGVAVDGLAAAEDEIVLGDFAYGLGEDVGSGEGVGGGGAAVIEKDGAIGAAAEGFAEDFAGGEGSHGDDGDGAAEAFADLEGGFEGVEVFGVEDGGQGGPIDRAVGFHGVAGDVGSVGNLLHTDNRVVGHETVLPDKRTQKGCKAKFFYCLRGQYVK